MFKRFLALSSIAFVLIAFSFQFPRIRSFSFGVFHSISAPVVEVSGSVARQASGLRWQFYNFWNAVEKQAELQKQIDELQSKLVRYDETVLENERLKKLLEFRDALPSKSEGVRIIGYGLKPWKKSVLLDKGSRHHLKNASPLVVPAGLVGRVVDVGPLSSQAIFITDPDSRVMATTITSHAQGIIEGNGGEKLKLRYLNLDDDVQIGEAVITSGKSDMFPKGLRIGQVESVERDGDGLHLSATIRPAVQFSKIEEMLCLQPSASESSS